MSTTTIDFDGLRKVIEAVEKAPPERFNMAKWSDQMDCGTVGCAIGWFCLLNPQDRLRLPNRLGPRLLGDDSRLGSWGSVCERFGLDYDDALELFHPSQYRDEDDDAPPVTKGEVIDRIRAFIREHEPEPAAH